MADRTAPDGKTKKTDRTCEIEGCDKKHLARGWCRPHYQRWYHSDAFIRKLLQTQEQRFWSKVDKGAEPDSCWLWTAATTNGGYGLFRWDGKMQLAHRVAYEMAYGTLPSGLELDHRCHSYAPTCQGGDECLHRACCNPLHLEAVSPRVNALRSRSFAAKNAAKSHCPLNHPYDAENTYIQPSSGKRYCRECKRQSNARRRQRQKSKAGRPIK